MFSQKKPYTAVTVTIDRLTSEAYDENDLSGLPDLVEVVNLQSFGPAEAARAIRKKLKYGNLHRQLRALTLLDGLIQNAGSHFQRTFADEPLLERLRFCATAPTSDPKVKKKCNELFRSWSVDYKNVRGMERVASLSKELPRRKQVVTQDKSKAVKESENPFGEDDNDEPPSQGSSSQAASSSRRKQSLSAGSGSNVAKDKKREKRGSNKKHKPFNLEAEKANMKEHIAEASIASTNLINTLQSINREHERISDNKMALQRFENAKQLRRKILRYIHHVESEEWLGSLLSANDQLVTALITFEQLDRSIDADSDSDDELAEQTHLYRMAQEKAAAGSAGPTSPTSPKPARVPPPRPPASSKPSIFTSSTSRSQEKKPMYTTDDEDSDAEEEDDDNPFADRNAVASKLDDGAKC